MILKGKPVADWIDEKTRSQAQDLLEKEGILPTLAILRVGNNGSDIAYENSAGKKAASLGIHTEKFIMDAKADESDILDIVKYLNEEPNIHGVLMLRPLPKDVDEERICNHLKPEKDIDGITNRTLGGIFTGEKTGFPPCTAEAVMAILSYYGIETTGKRAVVVGRSLVVGKPAAMMLMEKNATVAVCHSKTEEEHLAALCKGADIVVCATGRRNTLTGSHAGEKQVIVDVGINFDEEGKMCGDADFEALKDRVAAITPVPGGVGTVTTALLMRHVVQAAYAALQKERGLRP